MGKHASRKLDGRSAVSPALQSGSRAASVCPNAPLLQHSNHPLVFVLPGIKFNDGLLVGDGLDFIAGRDAHHDAFEGLFVQ